MKTNLPSFKSIIYVKFILIFFFLLAGFKNVHASHLVGGNIGYEYVGPSPFNPNVIEYKIYLDAYLDANSQFWGTGFPDPTINIGIYEVDIIMNYLNIVI